MIGFLPTHYFPLFRRVFGSTGLADWLSTGAAAATRTTNAAIGAVEGVFRGHAAGILKQAKKHYE